MTGDDFSKVRLFRYPVSERNALSDTYLGHAAQVTSARFLPSGEGLITTGGEDNSVIQWALTHVEDPGEEEFEIDPALESELELENFFCRTRYQYVECTLNGK